MADRSTRATPADIVSLFKKINWTGPLSEEEEKMKLVIIESPFTGDIEENVRYARAAIADSLARGEAPIASHLLYTQPGILDDNDPEERQWGIDAGLAWMHKADFVAVYVDRGISSGMRSAISYAHELDMLVELRMMYDWGSFPEDDTNAR